VVSAALADGERVEPAAPGDWAAWLEANHRRAHGVWLVTWKKATGRQVLTYEDAVTEALRFGWIDAVGRGLDDERSMLWFAPRKPGSGWSGPNKQRIARLLAEGRMAPAGQEAVDRAQADGSWTKLDDVERLVVPPDLALAFDRHPGSAATWEAFPRSVKRATLEWIVSAKRPETRARRIDEAARLAAAGERANQWPRT
jgi:uncharacterized protein YdeI (YjbR/CyaY-like superfamily)